LNLFYFGSSGKALFGAYHPPIGGTRKNEGVVLCPPIGVEGLRAQRALRQIATMLAKSGLHVLRFDYFGTGDSAGDCEDGSVQQWQSDIETAMEELKDTAGISRLHLVGLRLGGALAAILAERIDGIEKLVLWDPIVNGQDYLDEMTTADLAYEPDRHHPAKVAAALEQGQTLGVMGYAVTLQQRQQLQAIDLNQLGPLKSKRVFLLVSSETDASRKLKERLEGGARAAFQCIPSPGKWCEFDRFGSLLLPQAMVQGVVAFLR
jgi:exosortase A-associated hydrolase 2